jgi:hypothetical protein
MYPLRNLELPTRSKLQAGSLSTAFPTPLSSCFFPCRGEVDLHKLPPAHHNLENSRATPSRLGGFTSTSNKCHKDCFTNSSAQRIIKRILSTQNRISHKSHKPHKEVLGRAHKGLEMSMFHGWH